MTQLLSQALNELLDAPPHPDPVGALSSRQRRARRRRAALAAGATIALVTAGFTTIRAVSAPSGSSGSLTVSSDIVAGPGEPLPAADIPPVPGDERPVGEVVVAARVHTSKGDRALAAYTDGRGYLCSTLVEMRSGAGSTSCAAPDPPMLQVGSLGGYSNGDDPDLLFGEAPAGTAAVLVTSAGTHAPIPLYRVRVNGVDRLFFLREEAYSPGLTAEARDGSGRVIDRYPHAPG